MAARDASSESSNSLREQVKPGQEQFQQAGSSSPRPSTSKANGLSSPNWTSRESARYLTHPQPIKFPRSLSSRHDVPPRRANSSPRRCCTTPSARPPLDTRHHSTTYTSLPCEQPRTPGDEEGEGRSGFIWPRCFGQKSMAGGERHDLESGKGERQPLLSGQSPTTHHEGLPKVTRECLVAEIKCYGKVS